MTRQLQAGALSKSDFAPFGEVIEKEGSNSFLINNGKCRRHHALAQADAIGADARVAISIFSGQAYSLPHEINMVERHPLGSQAFFPLGDKPWLVIVCPDEGGSPGEPQAFLAKPDQGINLKRGLWHGVLTPLFEASDFLVVDRVGDGDNLEEHYFAEPYTIRVLAN